MDYQFIHSVVKGAYVDLPSGRAVPGAYLNELRSYAGAGDGLEHVPGGVYSYVTLRRGSEPAAAFLSHVERKKNASYPCNFIQSAGWTVHGDLLLRQFDTMLAQAFFTEEQVDGFAESGETPPLWEDGGRSLPDVSIHESALRAILYGCLFYWQTGAAPVRVAVPRSESARYNEYVLGAVREIYSHFPANMRAAVGFCSCLLPAHEANFRRFGLIFLPQAMADARTILLDGSSHSAYEAIPRSTGLVSLDLVLEYLISLKDPAARRSFLDTVYENVEAADKTGTFSPVTYSILGDYMRHLDPGSSVQDLIPLWLGFTADREKYPAALAQEIESCIEERLTGEELKRYAGSVLSDQSSPEEVLRAEGSLLRLCAGRDDCRQAVWEDLSARLAGSGCRPEDVYGALRHHRSALSGLAGPDAYERELSVWGLKIAQERRDREIGELRKLPDQYPRATEDLSRALNTRVEAFRQEIQPYTGEGELAELCAEVRGEADRLLLCRLEELVCLAPVSGQTSDESIDTWLKRLQRIETMLPGIRESDALRDEIRAKQERLTEIGLSRDAQLHELIDAIGGETNYFSALKRAAETVGAFSSVKIGQVRDTLRRRRPISCISYAKAYRDTFGSSVTVCARPEKPGFFTDVVEEDMAFFFGRTETISLSGKDTDTLVQDLDDLVRLADAFGHRGGLKVRLDERCEEDAAVVRQVCALESKSLTVRQFSSVSDVLLKNGCYQKTKLPDLLKLADKLEADLRPLTRRVLEGCVPDMDADDYRGFFEDLYPILPKNDYIACREWICEQARRTQPLDDEAKRALGALEKEIDAEKNRRRRRKRSLIIAAVTLGVLLLAGGVIYALHAFGVLSFGSKTEKPAEITAQTVENRRSGDALDLSGFENLSDLSILSGLEDIRVLKLDGDKQLKPGDLRDLKGLGALDYLSLSGIPGVTEDLAAEIAKNNNSCVVRWTESQQEHVYLCKTTLPLEGDAWEIPDASGLARLLPIRDELQSLRRLTLRSADLTADDLALLWELGGLEVLDLSGAGLRDETVSALTARDDLAEPAALRLLVLAGNPGLSDGAIELLRTTLPDACYIDRSGTGETSSDEVLIAGSAQAPAERRGPGAHRRHEQPGEPQSRRYDHPQAAGPVSAGVSERAERQRLQAGKRPRPQRSGRAQASGPERRSASARNDAQASKVSAHAEAVRMRPERASLRQRPRRSRDPGSERERACRRQPERADRKLAQGPDAGELRPERGVRSQSARLPADAGPERQFRFRSECRRNAAPVAARPLAGKERGESHPARHERAGKPVLAEPVGYRLAAPGH